VVGATARVAARPRMSSASVAVPAVGVAGVTLLAGVLRLHRLAGVPANPFYDAAVRSMSLSWHNFFFAAFEPGGRIAVDKPPVDLWLQVASVKLLGFNAVALKLPEALAGVAAVPLMYDLVRRVFGRGAGFASALALAVLPVTVLTARSDTMDTLMMLLVVAAAWLVVRAAQTGRARFLYLAAAVMGIAFNVKLIEALLPLPALALLYLLASPKPRGSRAAHAVTATLVFVAVSLSWVVAVSASPGASHPYPLGSTNGSVWSSVFVFDGTDRLGLTNRHPGSRHEAAGPSPTRLLARSQPPLGLWVGSELVPALLFGGLGLLLAGVARAGPARGRGSSLRRAFTVALAVWLALGLVAFSSVGHLQPRYLEALSPAIAAALGIGLALAGGSVGRRTGARAGLALAIAGIGAYGLYLASGGSTPRWLAAVTALAALAALAAQALLTRVRGGGRHQIAALGVVCLVAALAVPAWASLAIARHHATDASTGARLPGRQVASLDRYLRAHQGRARYEIATLNAWQAAPLILASGRPALVIRNVDRRPLISAAALREKARRGELRYALLGSQCGGASSVRHSLRACPPAARWARAHGESVPVFGRRIGLYRISG
jgi:4-amino-4-deoxy-L-arabinose transferase-like glycosyltransferase